MEDKQKIVVVCGPTASGKTGLSIELAKIFDGEIISADSMQIYRGLDIGTAKATKEEQSRAVHHLIDIMNPDQPYNVNSFITMATEKVKEISAKNNLPIIAGGTGLYIESFLNGIQFSRQPDNSEMKKQLRDELNEKGIEYMYSQLEKIDAEYAKTVHPNNTTRVLRAIEIYRLTGHNMTYQRENSRPSESPYDYLIIGLNNHDRQKLYDSINRRVEIMMEQGIENEARYVWENKDIFKTCTAAIGYKEFFPYFEGNDSIENCVEKLKQASRNYAKRQLTWFNRMDAVNWLYIDEKDYKDKAILLVKNFLGH